MQLKTAEELRITEEQRCALVKALAFLQEDKIKYRPLEGPVLGFKSKGKVDHFNMRAWTREYECGTVCCIGGTAQALSGTSFPNSSVFRNRNLNNLFYPSNQEAWNATPQQAARALSNYLSTGYASWHKAMRNCHLTLNGLDCDRNMGA
mgnify:FL=1